LRNHVAEIDGKKLGVLPRGRQTLVEPDTCSAPT
jgi:hypothetical protein